jgi:hypothetical protein
MELFDGSAKVLQKVILSIRASHESLQVQDRFKSALWQLNEASEALSEALDSEAAFGKRARAAHGSESAAALSQWQACRKEVEHRQEAYYEAVSDFRDYVSSLPRHLRSSATEQGLRGMAVGSP